MVTEISIKYPGGSTRITAAGMSVPIFQVCPLGHFLHVFITTPIVSALNNYYTERFLEVPKGILNNFWIQIAVSFLKPPHGGFRSETAVT